MTVLEKIEHLDQQLLIFINNARIPWLDPIMLYATDKWWWIPLYVIIVYILYKRNGLKHTIITLIGAALLITLCDRISVVMFKDAIERFRPCHNEIISKFLVILDGTCNGKYGFVSSHAANYFGLAFFLTAVLKTNRKYTILLFVWAFFIAYTRMYLGVHYPSDILGGALLGVFLGYLVVALLNWVLSKQKGLPEKPNHLDFT